MAKSHLRNRILRLAAKNASLRPELLRLLTARGLTPEEQTALQGANNGGTSVIPIVIQAPPAAPVQQAPIIVQQTAPGAAPAAPMMVPVTPDATTPWGMPAAPGTVSPNLTTDQTPGAPESAGPPTAALLVTERTQKGFESDLKPELVRLHAEGLTREQSGSEILTLIQRAFTRKDLLYNILIRHQSTFETDAEYRESLERLVQAWVSDTSSGG